MSKADLVPWWVPAVFLLVGLVGSIVFFIKRRHVRAQRRRALRNMAQRLRLCYPERTDDTARSAALQDTLGMSPACARDTLSGKWQGQDVHVYMSALGPQSLSLCGRSRKDSHFLCVFLEVPGRLPEVAMEPRRPRWDVDLTKGIYDVSLESAEFSNAFHVRSRNPKLAYDICHPRMMEYLLANDDVTVRIAGSCLAVYAEYSDYCVRDVEDIPKRLTQLVEIRKLMPEFVFQASYEGTEWTLPLSSSQ